jgi:aconitate hydratase
MTSNSFGSLGSLEAGGASHRVHRLAALESDYGVSRLPYSLKVLLENLLRHEDGSTVTASEIEQLAQWRGSASDQEIAFSPARILLQDFTGVPAVADLGAMRDAMAALGGRPEAVDPQIPADLVIDHSVVVEVHGRADAFSRNAELELTRNRERYQLLRWGQSALRGMRVVPPDTGICHQVNLEYLSQVVFTGDRGLAYPDTLVGADSHTTMVNGLGVVGWGAGGIEAEAALLGQPISMLVPEVVGLKLSGSLPEGASATDLVLTVTELLRRHGVVGKFVEVYGPGVASVPLENRATIGNMSPEYGSTVTVFPIDDETLRYLRFTGRAPEHVALVEAYAKDQGLWHEPGHEPVFSETVELDLSTVVPSLAGPARPQDLVRLDQAKERFVASLSASVPPDRGDPPADERAEDATGSSSERPRRRVAVTLADGTSVELDHGHVAIAAITSCTNTSNPQVMMAAGLLAKNAVDRGLSTKPWVKTSLAPGSKVVVEYYQQSGVLPYLEKLGFFLVGFGCTTCIGNSGPLDPAISEAVNRGGLSLVSVLSGNRNFEGRIQGDVRMNYLASPPLVVAYALAGTMDFDPYHEPLGTGHDGQPVYLRDLWPTSNDVSEAIRTSLEASMFRKSYGSVMEGDERWQALDSPTGEHFAWDAASTYVRRPPFFDGVGPAPAPLRDVEGARVLAMLGDSVTTDHISPAGTIRPESPAGKWLIERGVEPFDFNSYGARRGNDEVMVRGTFANPRLRNHLVPGTEGGITVHLPDGEQTTIYDAAVRYQREGVPLVVLAGKEYGSGSSRDWAAKGVALLGVRAVLAESFERIHRSNLVGMGILPLEFPPGESAQSLGLTGREVFAISGLAGLGPDDPMPRRLEVQADGIRFAARLRIDTPKEAEYYRHGGILHYVLRQLLAR